MSENTTAITDDSFEKDVLKSEQPVLLDFWAEWCGPCKMIAPVLEQIAGERSDLTIAKINIDENPGTAVKYGVLSIPTLILFKQGKAVATQVGMVTKSQLTAFIEEHI